MEFIFLTEVWQSCYNKLHQQNHIYTSIASLWYALTLYKFQLVITLSSISICLRKSSLCEEAVSSRFCLQHPVTLSGERFPVLTSEHNSADLHTVDHILDPLLAPLTPVSPYTLLSEAGSNTIKEMRCLLNAGEGWESRLRTRLCRNASRGKIELHHRGSCRLWGCTAYFWPREQEAGLGKEPCFCWLCSNSLPLDTQEASPWAPDAAQKASCLCAPASAGKQPEGTEHWPPPSHLELPNITWV